MLKNAASLGNYSYHWTLYLKMPLKCVRTIPVASYLPITPCLLENLSISICDITLFEIWSNPAPFDLCAAKLKTCLPTL